MLASSGASFVFSTMHCCIYCVRYIRCFPVLSGPSSRQDNVLSMHDSLKSRCSSLRYESSSARRVALIFSGTWFGISAAPVCGRGEYLKEYEFIYLIFCAIRIVSAKSSSVSPGNPTIKSDEI